MLFRIPSKKLHTHQNTCQHPKRKKKYEDVHFFPLNEATETKPWFIEDRKEGSG